MRKRQVSVFFASGHKGHQVTRGNDHVTVLDRGWYARQPSGEIMGPYRGKRLIRRIWGEFVLEASAHEVAA
jgi:hypothetical protein